MEYKAYHKCFINKYYKEVSYMIQVNLTPKELQEIEDSIDMTDIDKEMENVNYNQDPN